MITTTAVTTAAAVAITTTSVVMIAAVFIAILLLLVACAVVASTPHSSDMNEAMTIEQDLSTVMNNAPIDIAVPDDIQLVKWDTSTDTEVVGASLISARKVTASLDLGKH